MAMEAGMGMVEVRDFVIWAKHIHGDDELQNKILALPAGQLVQLEVNGLAGHWKKMDDNRTTGEATPGIKPIGRTLDSWKKIYQFKRGDLVSIKWA